jgi:hypothetical protein
MLMISCRTLTHVRFDLFRKYLLIDKEIINYLGKVSYVKETPRRRIKVTSSLNENSKDMLGEVLCWNLEI